MDKKCCYIKCSGKSFRHHLLQHTNPDAMVRMWNWIPEKYRHDLEVMSRLPCLKHYNRSDQRTHIDGPPPPRYKCYECIARNSV